MVRPCSCPTGASCSAGRVSNASPPALPAASLYGLARGPAQRSEPVYFPAPRRALFQPRLLLPIDGAAAQLFSGARDPIAPPARRPNAILDQTRAHDDHRISAGGHEPSRDMMRSAHLTVHIPRTPDRSGASQAKPRRWTAKTPPALDRPCARRLRELRSWNNARGADRTKEWTQLPTRSHPATSP
jgi:hypothetical protein